MTIRQAAPVPRIEVDGSAQRPGSREAELMIGIDTGGTYTDAVLLDYGSRRVLSTAKRLTTQEDLSKGIAAAIESLTIPDREAVRLVGISSTLATNSIAEGKLRDVGLLLIGYDRELIEDYGLDAKLTAKAVRYVDGGHTSQGEERAPLDIAGIDAFAQGVAWEVDAIAISGYFSPLDPSHEQRALSIVREGCGHPVVLGHELSTQLDSVKRAATACLNAALVAVMQEFVEAVRRALAHHRVFAPLMIVKGDGSLIPYEQAVERPVETIVSGPAASAVGARFLTGRDRAVVIDVGGTTTDIALIDEGRVPTDDEGARVGGVRTAVKASRVRTACLGGDSWVRVDQDGGIRIGPDRVVPIGRLASRVPRVEQEVLRLGRRPSRAWKPTDLEYWLLRRRPSEAGLAGSSELSCRLLDKLGEGPQCLSRLLADLEVHHPVQLGAEELLQHRIIERAGLTPTDLLHVGGALKLWSTPAARQAAACVASLHEIELDELVERALDVVVSRMVEETIIFLAGASGESGLDHDITVDPWGRWFLRRAMDRADPYLSVAISGCRLPVVGVGGPADIFIRKVADKLRTEFVLPPSSAVANAVGAVAGSVVVSEEALVYRQENDEVTRYVVQVEGACRAFRLRREAHRYAERRTRARALERAIAAGAQSPHVSLGVGSDGPLERVEARAVGSPRVSRRAPCRS